MKKLFFIIAVALILSQMALAAETAERKVPKTFAELEQFYAENGHKEQIIPESLTKEQLEPEKEKSDVIYTLLALGIIVTIWVAYSKTAKRKQKSF